MVDEFSVFDSDKVKDLVVQTKHGQTESYFSFVTDTRSSKSNSGPVLVDSSNCLAGPLCSAVREGASLHESFLRTMHVAPFFPHAPSFLL